MMNSRDTHLHHGPGKGDHDRTSDVNAFKENLAAIPFNPDDKTGFEKVAHGRFRKTYGKTEKEQSAPPAEEVVPAPPPAPLMNAVRAARASLSGTPSSEH